MKRLITAIILFIFLIVACFTTYSYVEKSTRSITDVISVSESYTKQGDFAAAEDTIHRSYDEWRKTKEILGIMLRHNELDDAERLFQRALQALDNQDQNEALSQLAELRAMLQYIPEMERLQLSNVL